MKQQSKTTARARRLVAVIAIAAFASTACGSSGGGSSETELIGWFQDQGETAEAAACFAKELSSYSTDDLDAFNDAEGADDVSEDMLADVSSAAEKCSAL